MLPTLGHFMPHNWEQQAEAPNGEPRGKKEYTILHRRPNMATCSVVLKYNDTTTSEADDGHTPRQRQMLMDEVSPECSEVEVNMNLRSGKALPELQRPQPKKGAKEDAPRTKDAAAQENSQDIPPNSGGESHKIDYNVVTHLKRILALLSVYDALLLIPELRQALIKALEAPEVYEVTMAKHRLL